MTELQLKARDFHEVFGLNVIPLIEKRPAVPSWSEWQIKEQDFIDLNSFDWNEKVTGFGIISGINNVRVIDIDGVVNPKMLERILDSLGLTNNYKWLVMSGSGKGFHIWIRCLANDFEIDSCKLNWEAKSVWKFKAKNKELFDHIELRWKNCQTAFPPSLHTSGNRYSFLNDIPEDDPALVEPKIVYGALDSICEIGKIEQSKTEEKSTAIVPQRIDEDELEQMAETIGQNMSAGSYEKWLQIGFGLASLGELGRKYFLKLSLANENYSDTEEEINKKFDELLRDYDGRVTLGSIYKIAKEYGWKRELPEFWYESGGKLLIDETKFLDFLRAAGFRKMKIGREYIYYKDTDNIIREVTTSDIKDFIVKYVNSLDYQITPGSTKRDLMSAIIKQRVKIFSDPFIDFLETEELKIKRDTAGKAFFYFENGFVEVTKENIRLLPYSELDGKIWEQRILRRKFERTYEVSDFGDFLMNICKGDKLRYDALTSAMGYLMHTYKDVSLAKAIIFLDEKLSDSAFGRSGKGLVSNAIGKMRKLTELDGRNFDFGKSFAMQRVSLDTEIIKFDDVRKKFPFERLFSIITEGIIIEKKNRDEYKISFEESPKILLTTNYSIEGSDDSTLDREFVIEFSDYYNKSHRPVDDFGKRFFVDWDENDWRAFDNLMTRFVQYYLNFGLREYERVNLEMKKLIDSTCLEFAEFADDIVIGHEYNKKDLFEDFRNENKDYENMKQNTFTRWIKIWANLKGYRIEERKSAGDRFVRVEG